MSSSHLEKSLFNNENLSVHLDTLLEIWAIMLLIVLITAFFSRKLTSEAGKMGKVQFIFESIYDIWEKQVYSQIKWQSQKFIPLIGSLFVFVLIAYWFGLLPIWKFIILIPGWPSLPNGEKLELMPPTNDINVTLGLAIIALIAYLWAGTASSGLSYWLPYFGFSIDSNKKIKFDPLGIITASIEWLDLLIRPLTLSLRLFANTFAGDMLLMTVIKLSPFLVPLLALVFEFFVGILQAFIFAMLTTIYIATACSHSSGNHSHAHK